MKRQHDVQNVVDALQASQMDLDDELLNVLAISFMDTKFVVEDDCLRENIQERFRELQYQMASSQQSFAATALLSQPFDMALLNDVITCLNPKSTNAGIQSAYAGSEHEDDGSDLEEELADVLQELLEDNDYADNRVDIDLPIAPIPDVSTSMIMTAKQLASQYISLNNNNRIWHSFLKDFQK